MKRNYSQLNTELSINGCFWYGYGDSDFESSILVEWVMNFFVPLLLKVSTPTFQIENHHTPVSK